MAAKANPTESSVRINFRLNLKRPKERAIWEFLQGHAENYDASRIIKQLLYEVATGHSWITGEVLLSAPISPAESPSTAPQQRAAEVLDDILSGLNDW